MEKIAGFMVRQDILDIKNKIRIRVVYTLCLLSFSLFYALCSAAMSPSEVVKKYCEYDLSGARASNEIDKLYIWTGNYDMDEPGWDCMITISGFKVLGERIKGNKATVKVEYDIISNRCEGYEGWKKQYKEFVDVKLVKDEWKLSWYISSPRISIDIAINRLKGIIESNKGKMFEDFVSNSKRELEYLEKIKAKGGDEGNKLEHK